jgi:subtilisin family serine protease
MQAHDWYDRRGHGTHCLGTILGRSVGGVRIGVAPGITDVIVGKVISDTGVGDHLQLIEAITWAFEQRADIINISLEYDWPAKVREIMIRRKVTSDKANDMVRKLHHDHMRFFEEVLLNDLQQLAHIRLRTPPLVIAACGNGNDQRDPDNQLTVSFPGAARGVLSVAAAGKSGKDLYLAHFCNNGATLCAPGVDVSSAASGGETEPKLKTDSGTSMAAPHAAGVAALWWQLAREQGCKPQKIARCVESSLRYTALVDGLAGSVNAGLIDHGLVQAPAPLKSDGAAQQRNSCTIS